MSAAAGAGGSYWHEQGFARWPMCGCFVPALAEVYYKPQGGRLVFGVEVAPVHCNGFAIAHGGFIATMADIWLGYNVAHVLPAEARFATASLTVDFLRAVNSGERLQCRMDHVKLGRKLHNAAGVVLVGARAVAAMRATFCTVPR